MLINITSAMLACVVALSAADTTQLSGLSIPLSLPGGPVAASLASAVRVEEDTVPRRRRAVEVSEWYERRLRIHRYGSYAMYPLFVLQAVAGNQVYADQKGAPEWAKTGHRVGAAGLSAVFTSNTVTGLWNLYESRSSEAGRTKRILHTVLMLGADAGFTYAGVRLAEQAETSGEKRAQHRKVAYGSMASTLAGVAVMRFWPEN